MRAAIGNWCRQLAALAAQGREVVMVSSGAIAEGMKRLGWPTRPKEIHELQAAAAVGPDGPGADLRDQAARARHGQRAGAADACRPGRPRALPERALDAADAAAPEAWCRSSTRTTPSSTTRSSSATTTRSGALVANLVEADALVILTDQKGLYSADPRKRPDCALHRRGRRRRRPSSKQMAGGAGSSIGRGGMITKVLAAKRAAGSGARTVIAWGREPDVLLRLAAGEAIGTLLTAPPRRSWPRASSGWPTTCSCAARSSIDDGAVREAARRRQEPAADRHGRGARASSCAAT